MTINYRRSAQLIILGLLGAPHLSHALEEVAFRQEVHLLSAEAQYAQVVSRLSQVDWVSESDAELLIAYCAARFVVMAQEDTYAISQRSDLEAKLFADALWKTWSGKPRTAEAMFKQLSSNERWVVWGEIGSLEVAYYTENQRDLGWRLGRLQDELKQERSKMGRLYGRYLLLHAEATLDWKSLERLLDEHLLDDIANEPSLFSAMSRLLFVRGKAAELARLLEASSRLSGTTVHHLRKADLLVLEKGIEESKEAIRQFARSHPDDPTMALEKAFVDLLSGSPEVSRAATDRLFSVASSSPKHVRLLLDMAVALASYHRPELARQVFQFMDDGHVDLMEFAAFHVLAAWNAIYSGELEEAKRRLENALDMAPEHVSANWLKGLIAKQQDDVIGGTEALKVLLAADPFNRNYGNVISHFRDKYSTPELEVMYRTYRRANQISD